VIVGIDPGFSGAIALLNPTTRELRVHDMPTLKSTKGKTITNLLALAEILVPNDHSARNISMKEDVSFMPLDGKDRVWAFGKHNGQLEMALTGFGYETHAVTPAVWKKHFKMTTGADKDASRALAIARFPHAAELFKRAMDHGRAEAALIALYALETVK
jgi:hypothetical protein